MVQPGFGRVFFFMKEKTRKVFSLRVSEKRPQRVYFFLFAACVNAGALLGGSIASARRHRLIRI